MLTQSKDEDGELESGGPGYSPFDAVPTWFHEWFEEVFLDCMCKQHEKETQRAEERANQQAAASLRRQQAAKELARKTASAQSQLIQELLVRTVKVKASAVVYCCPPSPLSLGA